MCKTKRAINAANPHSSPRTARSQPPGASSNLTLETTPSFDASTSNTNSAANTGSTGFRLHTENSISSPGPLTTLRANLPEKPPIYSFSEIRSATNNFLAKRYSSSFSPSWHCTLRGRDVIVFQRKFRQKIETSPLRERLAVIYRSHHGSIVKLLGASISGEHIYLVYEFVSGANLSDCLRNTKNPHFTVLSSWMSRMQVATDLAHGLDYMHNQTGLNISFVHNHIKSSSIIVTEPSFNAKICHFGAAQLCAEIDEENESMIKPVGEITEESSSSPSFMKARESKLSGRTIMKIEGVRGYMSPELQYTGVATQKSDVYAFGVVMLELLSGEEPLRYKFDRNTGDFTRTSLIETARAAIDGSGGKRSVEGGLRNWLDRRLKDSFPVEIAEKVIRIALDCVHVDPDKRPNMGRVADKISKLYLESRIWSDKMRMPTEISLSLVPR